MTELTEKQIESIEDAIACTDEPDAAHCDNLAVMLCSYFSRHLDRPEEDEETDDNHHWGAWVIEREKTMRRAIAMAAIKAYERAVK